MPRLVSLIASSTEIVCALGLEDQLVGRSHECDYPPAVKKLPVCTAPKFNLDGSSYEIDQRVKALVQEGLSVYRVDAAKLHELRPEIIITRDKSFWRGRQAFTLVDVGTIAGKRSGDYFAFALRF